MHRRSPHLTALCAALLLVGVACGGGGSDGASDDPDASAVTVADSSADDSSTVVAPTTDEATTEPASTQVVDTTASTEAGDSRDITDASFEASDVGFRTINLLDMPVDLYVITTGLREAWSVASSVAPGEVTDFASPPVDGSYLVTTEGSGDPTCVIDCEHHIAEFSTANFAENGPFRTVLVHPDTDTGEPTSMEFWELPDAGSGVGSSNAMPTADPTTTLIAVNAVAVRDAEFGLRLSIESEPGCATHLAADSRLIGGNQVLTFATGEAAAFSLHGFDASDCTGEPLAGPFAIDAQPGARFHAVLHGEGSDIDALLVPMVDGLGSGESASDDSHESAIAQMTDEVVNEFDLDDDQASCLATLLVDRLGSDLLLDEAGKLVDLDSLDDEVNALAGAAIFDSVDECGIDPSVFGA